MIHATINEERSATSVPWVVPPAGSDARSHASHPGAARLGAAVAIAICAVVAALGWLLAAPEGWIVGVIGLPGTTALAWRIAPRVIDATRRGAVARALGLAVGSVMITDALVSIVMAAAETLGGISTLSADGRELTLPAIATAGLTALALAIFLFLVGAVFVGLVVLASVVPLAFIWAGLVRLLAGRGWAR